MEKILCPTIHVHRQHDCSYVDVGTVCYTVSHSMFVWTLPSHAYFSCASLDNVCPLDFTDPLAELQKETLSLLSTIRKNNNLNPFPSKAEESESDQFIRESEYKNSERTPTRQYGQRSRPTLDMHDIYRSLNWMVQNRTSALL